MAHAFEFITHGGFEIVRDAWLFVSNLMSSHTYRDVLLLAFIGSFFIAAVGGTLKGIFRLDSMYSWLISMFIAIFVYVAFFGVPVSSHAPWVLRGHLTIRDDVKNRSQIIENIPPGLALLASVFNGFQITLEEFAEALITGPYTDTTSPVMGVKMLRDATQGQLLGIVYTLIPEEVKRSLWTYYNDVASVVLAANPNIKTRWEGSSGSLLDALQDTAHPALYTTTWLNSSGGLMSTSEVVTGREAYNRLKAYFDSAVTSTAGTKGSLVEAIERYCDYFYFDSGDYGSLSACKNILSELEDNILKTNYSQPEKFARDIFLGFLWNKYVAQLGNSGSMFTLAGAVTAVGGNSAMVSTGIVLEQWLPTAKIVLTVFIIGITPLVMIFLVTSFYGRALTTLFGLYIWLLLWGVVDKIVESFWISYMLHMTKILDSSIGGGGVSITAQSLYWPLASKIVAVLGGMRGMSMTLSGILSYGIIGFGGHVFARMLGSLEASLSADKVRVSDMVHASHKGQSDLANQMVSQAAWEPFLNETNPKDWYFGGAGSKISGLASGKAAWEQGSMDYLTSQAGLKYIGGQAKMDQIFQGMTSLHGGSASQILNVLRGMPIGQVDRGGSGISQGIAEGVFGRSLMQGLANHEQFKHLAQGAVDLVRGSYVQKGFPGGPMTISGIGRKDNLDTLIGLGRAAHWGDNVIKGLQDLKRNLGPNDTFSFSVTGSPDGVSELLVQHGGRTYRYDQYDIQDIGTATINRDHLILRVGDQQMALSDVNIMQRGDNISIVGKNEQGNEIVVSGVGSLSGNSVTLADEAFSMKVVHGALQYDAGSMSLLELFTKDPKQAEWLVGYYKSMGNEKAIEALAAGLASDLNKVVQARYSESADFRGGSSLVGVGNFGARGLAGNKSIEGGKSFGKSSHLGRFMLDGKMSLTSDFSENLSFDKVYSNIYGMLTKGDSAHEIVSDIGNYVGGIIGRTKGLEGKGLDPSAWGLAKDHWKDAAEVAAPGFIAGVASIGLDFLREYGKGALAAGKKVKDIAGSFFSKVKNSQVGQFLAQDAELFTGAVGYMLGLDFALAAGGLGVLAVAAHKAATPEGREELRQISNAMKDKVRDAIGMSDHRGPLEMPLSEVWDKVSDKVEGWWESFKTHFGVSDDQKEQFITSLKQGLNFATLHGEQLLTQDPTIARKLIESEMKKQFNITMYRQDEIQQQIEDLKSKIKTPEGDIPSNSYSGIH